MAEVYWGITTDGAKGQPVKHVTKENLRDLEVVDFKIYSPEEVILRQAKQAEAASYVIEGSVIPVTDVTTPLLKKDLNGG